MRPVIRTKDQELLEHAGSLRAVATSLEQLCDDPSHMPPPPYGPRRLSWHESIRAKKISVPAAGGWAAGVALGVEIARILLEHLR